jgi:hypothetical protein
MEEFSEEGIEQMLGMERTLSRIDITLKKFKTGDKA